MLKVSKIYQWVDKKSICVFINVEVLARSCFTQNKTKEKPQKTIQNFTDSLKTLKPAKIYVTLIKDVYLF